MACDLVSGKKLWLVLPVVRPCSSGDLCGFSLRLMLQVAMIIAEFSMYLHSYVRSAESNGPMNPCSGQHWYVPPFSRVVLPHADWAATAYTVKSYVNRSSTLPHQWY